MTRQNDSDDRSNIADIDHTPHRYRPLTVFHKHLRTSPAIPTSIVRRNSGVSVKVLFELLKRKNGGTGRSFFAGLGRVMHAQYEAEMRSWREMC
jgi:hypothetical protein